MGATDAPGGIDAEGGAADAEILEDDTGADVDAAGDDLYEDAADEADALEGAVAEAEEGAADEDVEAAADEA